MVKLVALYMTPDEPSAFDSHYSDIHAPIVQRWPGLRKYEAAKVTGNPIGEQKLYMIEEMYFDDEEAMQHALSSPDGKVAMNDLTEFAGTRVSLFIADVLEGS